VREARIMGTLYENAFCTVAASSRENPHDGMFTSRNPLRDLPCRVPVPQSGIWYAFSEHQVGLQSIRTSHLNTRAWVYQESMLSHRILYFSAFGVYWSCRHYEAYERNYLGSRYFHESLYISSGSGEHHAGNPGPAHKKLDELQLSDETVYGSLIGTNPGSSSTVRLGLCREFIDNTHSVSQYPLNHGHILESNGTRRWVNTLTAL
jgi:hypothetical protein